jgi:hypothetical protein
MPDQLQEVVNRLESLQYDILFWKRKEDDIEKVEKLGDYDQYIEDIIDMIFDIET